MHIPLNSHDQTGYSGFPSVLMLYLILYILVFSYILHVCICYHVTNAIKVQKSKLNTLELELRMAMNYYVGSEN